MVFSLRPLLLSTSLTLGFVMSFAASSAASTEPDREAEIVQSVRLPDIPDRDYVITDFGAVVGANADALPAITAAIKQAVADGGGRVIIPAGSWSSGGPIHLASRINLHIAEGATVLFSPEARDYLPAVPTRWEGTEMRGYSPLIYAAHVHDVAITGKGTFDGNATSEFFTWITMADPDMQALRRSGVDGTPEDQRVYAEGSRLRPSMVQFFHAERVLLEDYTLHNSPFWVNHLVYTDHATVRRIRVESHHPNNDGVDVDSSRNVLIEDCWFRTGDDSVVVKSGRDRDGREVGRPSENVVVRRNDMGGEDGIALGSEMSGGIRHVYFSDNVLRHGASAIRFKANLDRGGTVEHIRVRNFTVESFETLFWFQLNYPGLLGGGHPSTYRDIVFENFTVERAGTVMEAHAPAESPLRDVTLRNIVIKQADHTFVLENVEDLKLENVVIGGQRVDGQPDSTVWQLDNLKSVAGHPLTVLGHPQVIDTPGGKAIAFDGIDDALLLETHPLAGWTAFTVEVIFRPDADGAHEQRFFHMQEHDSDSRVMFETRVLEQGRWFLDTFIKSGKQKIVNYAQDHLHPTDAWYHAAIVVDGKSFKHFVNGQLELDSEIDYAPQQPGRMSLGVRLNQVNWFKGAIRTIRFTPHPLAPDAFLTAQD